MNGDIKAFQNVLVKFAKRIDKLEAQIVELQGFVGYIKEKEVKKAKKIDIEEKKVKKSKMEFDTIKSHLGDMI